VRDPPFNAAPPRSRRVLLEAELQLRPAHTHASPNPPLPPIDMAMFHEKGNYDSLMGEMDHPAVKAKASSASPPRGGERRRSSLSATVLAAAGRSRNGGRAPER